jgi:NADH pyrophosphatase-like rudimentary NUDIX domain
MPRVRPVRAHANNLKGDAASSSSMPPAVYTEYPLDRAANSRAKNLSLESSPPDATALILMHKGAVLCEACAGHVAQPAPHHEHSHTDANALRLAVARHIAAFHSVLVPDMPAVLLGVDKEHTSIFGAEVTDCNDTTDAFRQATTSSHSCNGEAAVNSSVSLEWVDVRKHGAELLAGDAALAATAAGMLAWHSNQRLSAVTGERLHAKSSGWALQGGSDEKFAIHYLMGMLIGCMSLLRQQSCNSERNVVPAGLELLMNGVAVAACVKCAGRCTHALILR